MPKPLPQSSAERGYQIETSDGRGYNNNFPAEQSLDIYGEDKLSDTNKNLQNVELKHLPSSDSEAENLKTFLSKNAQHIVRFYMPIGTRADKFLRFVSDNLVQLDTLSVMSDEKDPLDDATVIQPIHYKKVTHFTANLAYTNNLHWVGAERLIHLLEFPQLRTLVLAVQHSKNVALFEKWITQHKRLTDLIIILQELTVKQIEYFALSLPALTDLFIRWSTVDTLKDAMSKDLKQVVRIHVRYAGESEEIDLADAGLNPMWRMVESATIKTVTFVRDGAAPVAVQENGQRPEANVATMPGLVDSGNRPAAQRNTPPPGVQASVAGSGVGTTVDQPATKVSPALPATTSTLLVRFMPSAAGSPPPQSLLTTPDQTKSVTAATDGNGGMEVDAPRPTLEPENETPRAIKPPASKIDSVTPPMEDPPSEEPQGGHARTEEPPTESQKCNVFRKIHRFLGSALFYNY